MRFRIYHLILIMSGIVIFSWMIFDNKSSVQQSGYPDLGLAPELTNDTWLNTDRPLRLSELRGKVVLIDMWTFG